MGRSPVKIRPPRKTKADWQAEAYNLLGVDEYDVLAVQKIEPLLKRSDVLGKVWQFLEVSPKEVCKKLLAQRMKLTSNSLRNAVPFEAYCVAAGIDTAEALGVIVSEVYTQNEQAAGLMASMAQPDVVKATIDRAVEPGGSRERDMLHKHSNFVPVPKTMVTFVGKADKVVGGDDHSQNLTVLPPIEQVVRQVSDRFNEKLLGAAPQQPDVFETEPIEEDDEGDEE